MNIFFDKITCLRNLINIICLNRSIKCPKNCPGDDIIIVYLLSQKIKLIIRPGIFISRILKTYSSRIQYCGVIIYKDVQ